MQKRKGRGLPTLAESREPPQGSSRSPGWRARLLLMAERFGFLLACVLTLIALVAFIIGTELLKGKADQASGRTIAQEQSLLAEGQSGSAGQPELAVAADVSLSISTNPVGAAIYVDGDYAGVSPLRGLVVAQGRRLISVNKPDYAQYDTFLTFNEPFASLKFSLLNGDVVLAATRESTPPEARSAPPSTPRPEAKQSAPATASPVAQKQTPAPSVADAQDEPAEGESAQDEPVQDEPVQDEPVVQVGELHVVSEPAGALVLVAGKEVGVTPLVLPGVQAGPQHVTLRLDGYEDFITTVAVTAQQRSTINGQLAHLLGTLKVLAKPWGTIYIDGELYKNEASTWYSAKLTPGYHRLRVQHPSLGTWEQVVDVAAGEEHPITIDFNKDS